MEQQLLERQTNRDLQASVGYPFSHVQRLELSGRSATSPSTVSSRPGPSTCSPASSPRRRSEDLDAPESSGPAPSRAALVYDNSFFGATGPIVGQRYRLEVSPTFGSLDLRGDAGGLTVATSCRNVRSPSPPGCCTTAATAPAARTRGSSSSSSASPALFAATPTARSTARNATRRRATRPPVRCTTSSSAAACWSATWSSASRSSECWGSATATTAPSRSTSPSSATAAWPGTATTSPVSRAATAIRCSAPDAGFRFNLFGFAVAEVNVVRPFDRPRKNWIWEFNFQPGF